LRLGGSHDKVATPVPVASFAAAFISATSSTPDPVLPQAQSASASVTLMILMHRRIADSQLRRGHRTASKRCAIRRAASSRGHRNLFDMRAL
jgi:hypothetical protein